MLKSETWQLMIVVVPKMDPECTAHVFKFNICEEQTLRHKDIVHTIASTLYTEMSHQ